VIAAVGGSHLAFVATVAKKIMVYSIRRSESWKLIRSFETIHPATSMDIISDRLLAYGLGDEGYGSITFTTDSSGADILKMYEAAIGVEKDKKAAAKVSLIGSFNENGFVWRTGGYTTATKDRHKVPSWIVSFNLGEKGFQRITSIRHDAHILGEIDEDTWLLYLL